MKKRLPVEKHEDEPGAWQKSKVTDYRGNESEVTSFSEFRK